MKISVYELKQKIKYCQDTESRIALISVLADIEASAKVKINEESISYLELKNRIKAMKKINEINDNDNDNLDEKFLKLKSIKKQCETSLFFEVVEKEEIKKS